MKCPFCDSVMMDGYLNTKPLTLVWMCIRDGPLIDKKDHKQCPLRGKRMTQQDIDNTIISLIDAEME